MHECMCMCMCFCAYLRYVKATKLIQHEIESEFVCTSFIYCVLEGWFTGAL